MTRGLFTVLGALIIRFFLWHSRLLRGKHFLVDRVSLFDPLETPPDLNTEEIRPASGQVRERFARAAIVSHAIVPEVADDPLLEQQDGPKVSMPTGTDRDGYVGSGEFPKRRDGGGSTI
jgi:hypothetical protein